MPAYKEGAVPIEPLWNVRSEGFSPSSPPVRAVFLKLNYDLVELIGFEPTLSAPQTQWEKPDFPTTRNKKASKLKLQGCYE
jgi:hypothetical protein